MLEILELFELGVGSFLVIGLFAVALWQQDTVIYGISGIASFFIGISLISTYPGLAIAIIGLSSYEMFEAVIVAMSSAGPSKGISQFKAIANTIRSWF